MNQRKKNNPSRTQALKDKLIQSDLVSRVIDAWHSLPKLHQRVLMVLIPLVIVLLLLPSEKAPEPQTQEVVAKPTKPSRMTVPLVINGEETAATKPKPKVENNEKRVQLSDPESNSEDKPERKITNNAGPEPWNNYTVEKGDTLSQVFRNNDLSLSDLNQLVEIEGKDKPLSQIKHGQLIRFKLTNRGDLDILQIEKEDGPVMFFRLSSGGFARSTQ
ncbi:LysM-like peptidoglycan-binding domain-containing protein [Vibrio rumoiensis]|uniref:LysM-like peptidoglycan-binding domain-containing protein n=1 Tax=Vibrio rumoiensis TaxID=76258 RepID=A0ABW7IX82_9VIBR|nr:LysM-like peptidoglycan-binding domain-containing protein [Vibrio rumoiensis]